MKHGLMLAGTSGGQLRWGRGVVVVGQRPFLLHSPRSVIAKISYVDRLAYASDYENH